MSPNTCRSTDCVALLNNGMLLGTSICCFETLWSFDQIFKEKNWKFTIPRKLQITGLHVHVCAHVHVIGKIISRGSKMNANSFDIPQLLSSSLLQIFLPFYLMLLLRFWNLINLYQALLLHRWCQVDMYWFYFQLLHVRVPFM